MEPTALRNFKDFLLIYNRITEDCFNHCALLFSDRKRSNNEVLCVDTCAQKHININHKIMQLYMDIHSEFSEKKIQEVNKIQQEMIVAESKT